jgi:hypothetical protein
MSEEDAAIVAILQTPIGRSRVSLAREIVRTQAVLDAAEALVRAEEFGGGDFQTAAKAFRESVHAYRRARAGGGGA